MKKINEIFYSVQGEGRNSGKPAVFVRFSGCNIKCPFCDTEHLSGNFLTDEQIIQEIKKYPTNLVILTGGEPTLFCDQEFVSKLHNEGKIVAVETNGTNELKCDFDFVTLSPKFEFVEKAELKITRCNELKVVYDGTNQMERYDKIIADYYYLQPCDKGDKYKNKEIIDKTVEYVLQNPKWNISLQTQKILNVR